MKPKNQSYQRVNGKRNFCNSKTLSVIFLKLLTKKETAYCVPDYLNYLRRYKIMPLQKTKLLNNTSLRFQFTDKLITSYGGFALLAKLFEKLEVKENIEKMIPWTECSPNSTGVFAKVLRFGLTVIAGGKRFSHSMFLGDSLEIYEKEFNVERIPRSITSLTRFFNKFKSWQKTDQFAEDLWNYLMKIIPFQKIKEDYLSFDSTVITRYGKQEGALVGYNPKKKGRPSHHPIMAFLNRSKYVVNLWNRSGNTTSGHRINEFAKQTIERLNGKIKIKGCLADSGFYLIDFAKYLESISLEYVICAKFTQAIQHRVIEIEDWQRVDNGICVSEFYFEHKDEKWDKPRRYIVIRQEIPETKDPAKGRQITLFPELEEKYSRYRYGTYLTSSELESLDLWRLYRLRAGDENIIKETKNDFGFDGFSTQNFYSSEAVMLIGILFYNIINFFRTHFLAESESRRTLHTLRMNYFLVPAMLGKDGRDFILRIGLKSKKRKGKFIRIINEIDRYFNNCIAFDGNINGEAVNTEPLS